MVFDGIIISLIVGFLRKGNLRALSHLKLKWGWVFPVLLLTQIFVFTFQNDIPFLGQASDSIYIVVYIVGLVFLFMNRHHKGFNLIWIGVFLNFIVMVVNGGRMPVSVEASAVLDPGYIQALKDGLYGKHAILTEATKLGFLGDIIPLSDPYPRTQIISIGDVIMNIGIFFFIQNLMVKSSQTDETTLHADLTKDLEGGEVK
jgi:hypothetical protein